MNPKPPISPNRGLYRAKFACRIGRDTLEGNINLPAHWSATNYALFNLLHAVEGIADALMWRQASQDHPLPNPEEGVK